MSGGAYDYAYRRVEEMAEDVERYAGGDKLRLAFAVHLRKVAKALHDLEWVDSGDIGEGGEVGAIRDALMVATHEDVVRERDELRDRADKALVRAEAAERKYEALLAKATLPADVLSWASAVTVGPGAMRDAARAAERFLLALHAATKSEPTKRKTRIDVFVGTWFDGQAYKAPPAEREAVRKHGIEQLAAQGLQPDEELPEVAP